MVRLTRAQQQERTRTAVLAAAREEFAERGYGDAKVDRIAERAELTRGAVYSNFPSKRALYLAVLVDSLQPAVEAPAEVRSRGLGGAVAGFARAWLERLPFTGESAGGGNLRLRSLTGVFDDEPGRAALAQVTRLEAVLLGLALESSVPGEGRQVRLAELVLTLLSGAGHLAEVAPGVGDPLDVARACEHLAAVELADTWDPPHLPYVPPAQPVDGSWAPPAELPDLVTGGRVELGADGVVVLLGARRLAAAEEAVRAARPGDQVTVVVVTGDPGEVGRLVQLRVRDLAGCLRHVSTPGAWAGFGLVLDERHAVAGAAGVQDAGDATEAAVRVEAGRVVARAAGPGAGYAATTATRSVDG